MRKATARFHLYRYQLLPIDRYFQGDLYGIKSVEELIEKKNEIFANALKSSGSFTGKRSQTTAQLLFDADGFLLFRLAANRALHHETRDFKTEQIDNWPRILLAIWNDPEHQLVAVQHRTAAFQSTDAVMKIVFSSIEPFLSSRQLVAAWEPLFEKRIFWELARKYEGRIQELEFELITPNMANISRVLPEELRAFAKNTNALRSRVAVSSDAASALRVDHNNGTLKALVDYSSEGGGDIAIRLAGVKKKIHTSKTTREVSIEEVHLSGTPQDVANSLRQLLS